MLQYCFLIVLTHSSSNRKQSHSVFFSAYIVNDNNFSLSVLWGGREKICRQQRSASENSFFKKF